MIGYLSGKIIGKTNKLLLVNVNGVGYAVFTTGAIIQSAKISDGIELYIHTNVREDALELYGLASAEEIEFFKKLISISGVGPKSALGVLEVAKIDDIKKAIAHGDASLLTKVSGIGKKTAELIIIKLKDASVDLATENTANHGDAIDALISLGYSALDARQALAKIDPQIENAGDKVKAALKLLNKK